MEVVTEKAKGRGVRAKKIQTQEEIADSTTIIPVEPVEERLPRRRAATKKPIIEVEEDDIKKSKAPKRATKKAVPVPVATNGDTVKPPEDEAPKKGKGKKTVAPPPPAEPVLVASPKGKRGKPTVIPDEGGDNLVEDAPTVTKRGRGKIVPPVDDDDADDDVPVVAKRGRNKVTKTNVPEIVVQEPVVNKRSRATKKITAVLSEEEIVDDIPAKPKKGPGKKPTPVIEEEPEKVVAEVPKKRGKKAINTDEKNEKLTNSNIPEEKLPKRGRKIIDDINEEEEPKTKKSKATPKKKAKETKKPPPKSKLNPTTSDLSNVNFEIDNTDWNLKVSSWNVAGIRAWLQKGGLDYIHIEKPDIICLQETKCLNDDMPETATIKGYHPYWLCNKGGYAGVALYSKIMPMNIQYGIGDDEFDVNGRLMTAEYEKFFLVCVYVPNSGRKLVALAERMRWDIKFQTYLKDLDKQKPVILCGDMNVSHLEIDLANPKANKRNAGFTQEERDGLSTLLSQGFVDSFRHLYPKKEGAYTYWTYMANCRSKNVGWRLDYFILSKRIVSKLVDNVIRSEVYGSDHCPIALFMNM